MADRAINAPKPSLSCWLLAGEVGNISPISQLEDAHRARTEQVCKPVL
jgi:hypothetical protein